MCTLKPLTACLGNPIWIQRKIIWNCGSQVHTKVTQKVHPCLTNRSYSTIAWPLFSLYRTVLANAYPRATRKTPLPPMTDISLTALKTGFRPRMLSALPLYFPSSKAKFITTTNPKPCWEAKAYTPSALPTIFEWGSGPLVKGSSITMVVPNSFLGPAIRLAVGFLPLMMWWQ